MTTTESFTISESRYAKNQFVVKIPRPGIGIGIGIGYYKSRIHHLVEACGGRWVHRSNGYRMSAMQVDNFKKLHAAGWDAGLLFYRKQRPHFYKPENILNKFTLKEALAEL